MLFGFDKYNIMLKVKILLYCNFFLITLKHLAKQFIHDRIIKYKD